MRAFLKLQLIGLGISLAMLAGAQQPISTLSQKGEDSKAAFTALLKEKNGAGEARLRCLSMPGAEEFLASPQSMMGFIALRNSFQQDPQGAEEACKRLATLLPEIDHLRSWDGYMSIYLTRAAEKYADPQTAEQVRLGYIALLKRSISKKDFGMGRIADIAPEYFGKSLEHLTGNALLGKLLDRPAPALNFLWCSDPSLRRLSDLKGKVIVLDFWATWCKPCVGLFPTIRDIATSYEGKPVVFLGVTSVQGFSMDPKLGKTDTKGDPQKEFGLMPGLMTQLGVTWTVAFSDKDCFNPDFDIMDIPHMAVIDQSGVVRYDGVEPTDLKAKIDGLLSKG